MAAAQQPFHAFTVKFNGVADRILTRVQITQAFDPKSPPSPLPPQHSTNALWDTGATKSVLTTDTVKVLGLVPVGTTLVSHGGGASQANTYLVNILLPNGVGVVGVLVSESPPKPGEFGAIIGMDIITKGDLSLTHENGKTCMSFRVPSVKAVDFVAEATSIRFSGVNRNAPCPCGRKKPDGGPVKYKHCHGSAASP